MSRRGSQETETVVFCFVMFFFFFKAAPIGSPSQRP